MKSGKTNLILSAVVGLTAISVLVVAAVQVLSPPEADLWDKWAKHDDKSKATVSHEVWDDLLQKFVIKRADGVALVRYPAFDKEDRLALDHYVASLQEVDITDLNKEEQRAYWINMYNAVTVKVVLDHFPVKSIRDIDIASDVLANGPWKAKLVSVEGQELSLDDIEHRILRPIWQDPRIHYAINCGAISCPNLHNHAFTAQKMDETLDTLARDYVNDHRGIEVIDGEVHASKIYQWFQIDFGENDAEVLDHVRLYANDALRKKLEGITTIANYRYDWSLNQAPIQFAQARTKKSTRETSKERKSDSKREKDLKTSRRLRNLINNRGAAGGGGS